MSETGIELSERQRERFEQVREQCDEPDVPDPTDRQVMKGLLDTWDAVDDGGYDRPSTVYVVVTRHADDPHPKCEGVYLDEDDAESGQQDALDGLGAVAAEVYDMEVRS